MRRLIKLLLLAVVIAAAPFCWSIGRDLLPLLSSRSDAAQVEARIAIQIEAAHHRLHVGEHPPLSTIDLPHNCFSVPPDAVRANFRLLNKQIDGVDEQSRSLPSIVNMNSYGIAYANFAEARGVEVLQKKFSPIELAALNGCMAATPFAKWCDAQVETHMKFDFRLIEKDLVARGLMRHAMSEDGNEILCTTIPVIESDETPS